MLSLWRRVLRDTRRIADLETRAETRKMARDEFELNRNVKDIVSFTYPAFSNGWGGCGWLVNE